MQSSSMGDEDSAERNNVRLKRASEVSLGSARMLWTEMEQLKESSGKELETYKQKTKKLSQEMAELTALTEREKDLMTNELHTSTEARKQLAEIRNGIRVSTETEKELLTKELKSSRESVKRFSQEMNELRVFIETEKGILTKELKLFREAVTQLSQEINEERAFRGREKELPQNELKTSRKGRRHFSRNKSERRAFGKRQMGKHGNVKEMEKLRVSSSNESDEPVASRSTIFRKFQGFFGSSKSTRQGRRLFRKTQKEHKVNTEASPGMQLSAGPSHEHETTTHVQEHDKITDSPEISGSDEVESGSTGMGPTNRSVDNYVRQNQSDEALQQIAGRITTRGVYHGTDDSYVHFYEQVNHDPSQCTGQLSPSHPAQSLPSLTYEMDIRDQPNERTRIYRDPSQCTGQLSPSRPAQSLPLLIYEMDIRDLPNVIERLKNYAGQLLSVRSAESPSSLQHEIDIRDLPNSGIKIEQQPKSKKQPEGSEVIFELKVQEQDNYSYQWLKDGAELKGKCDAILILDNVELREFGWYKCRVCSRENFGINCESSRAWLDVVPKVQKGTRLKTFIEVDLSTCDRIAFYLDKDVPYGLGGNRQAAAVFGMTKDTIGALAASKSPGQVIVEFVKATKPDITVYEVFKQFKGDEMKRFDIAKILENHLTITESEV